MGAAIAALMMAAPAAFADDLKLPRERVKLVAPPFVHPHEQATKAGPKIVQFRLTVQEKEVVIDDAGTKMWAMTYNGSMPGPMMVLQKATTWSSRWSIPRPTPCRTTSTCTRRLELLAAAR